jgi:hypothetical protein
MKSRRFTSAMGFSPPVRPAFPSRFRPVLAGGAEGSESQLVILNAGNVLDSFIAADVPEVELIVSGRPKTVSKAVHAPPADGPCRNARRI